MTLEEFKQKIVDEIARAEAYTPRTDLGPFSMLAASPEYMRGGLAALRGVLKMLDEVKP